METIEWVIFGLEQEFGKEDSSLNKSQKRNFKLEFE